MRVIEDPCSRHFTYRDLIRCGKTAERLFTERGFENLPREPATWEGLSALACELLDPVTERFGRPTLTYCFASSALTREIPGRIAPALDQHAGAELTRTGRAVCTRGGQAVDFIVPGIPSLEIAEWIIESCPFDRLYFYGDAVPIHVSVPAARQSAARAIVLLCERRGRRVPRSIRRGETLREAIHILSLDPTDR